MNYASNDPSTPGQRLRNEPTKPSVARSSAASTLLALAAEVAGAIAAIGTQEPVLLHINSWLLPRSVSSPDKQVLAGSVAAGIAVWAFVWARAVTAQRIETAMTSVFFMVDPFKTQL
jgi:hypothetical protein